MNILITGAHGQLGTEMRNLSQQHLAHTYFFTDVDDLDITDRKAVGNYTKENAIDLIVNCAAYTNVDKAESDEATARRINAEAVANLASTGAKVIHISTDYVFSGEGWIPCREAELTAPRTAYGRTKLEGEQWLLSLCPNAIIMRTAWLYSPYGNNFVKTMIRLGLEKEELGVVYDQIGTPTYAADLAVAIYAAIESPEWKAGVYHFTNEGVCSWYDFTIQIHRIYNRLTKREKISCRVRPILTSEYQYKTPRPHYSVLDKTKIKRSFGIAIPYWLDSLEKCIQELVTVSEVKV